MTITFPLTVILWDLIFNTHRQHRRKLRWLIFLILILIIPLTVLLHSTNPKYNDSGQLGAWGASSGFEKISGGIDNIFQFDILNVV